MPETDVENQIDELYKRPVAEFVAARDELSRSLKKAGDAAAAARIKALEKPGLSSWAVNHLYWNARKDWDALTSVGGRLRSAQRRGDADQLREAVRERRQAMSVLLKQAEAALEAGGHMANPQTMGRISGTLEAIAAKGTFEAAGRLSHDLQAPGFEALSGLALVKPSATKPRAASVAAGQAHAAQSAEPEGDDHAARLEAAQFELRDRRRTAESAAAARDVADRRLEAAKDEESEAKRRLQRAGEAVREASAAAQLAREEAQQAASALAKAERALESLKQRKSHSQD